MYGNPDKSGLLSGFIRISKILAIAGLRLNRALNNLAQVDKRLFGVHLIAGFQCHAIQNRSK